MHSTFAKTRSLDSAAAGFTRAVQPMSMPQRREFFHAVIDANQNLNDDNKDEVKGHFDVVMDFIEKHGMRLALNSWDMFVDLQQKYDHEAIRRDETSAFNHQLSQAIYLIWIFERRERVIRFTARDYPEFHSKSASALFASELQLERALAVIFNHDSGEDFFLSSDEFVRGLIPGVSTLKLVVNAPQIVTSFELITQGEDESNEAYARRLGGDAFTLGLKLIDRTHNLMSLVGSNLSLSRILKYCDKTDTLLRENEGLIHSDAILHYLATYVYNQARANELYVQVKRGEMPVEIMAEFINEMTKRYETTTISRRIHPMLGIARRILRDPEIFNSLCEQEKAPVRELLHRIPGDLLLPTPAPRS